MPNPTLTEAIDRVAAGEDLDPSEASRVLGEMIDGNASEAQAAAFLIALRTKGETVGEIAGLAAVLRERAVRVDAGADGRFPSGAAFQGRDCERDRRLRRGNA